MISCFSFYSLSFYSPIISPLYSPVTSAPGSRYSGKINGFSDIMAHVFILKTDPFCRFVGFFSCLFQVFPFVEGNINLEDMISKKASAFDWEKRVYASTVFAFASGMVCA